MKINIDKMGLVLTEALLSVGMMASGVLIMGGIITTAVTTTQLSKNYLIAQNLVSEAVEAVKELRNTNKINDPSEKQCWLRIDPERPCEYATMVMQDGSYRLGKTENEFTSLVMITAGDLNLAKYSQGMEQYRLYFLNGVYTHTVATSQQSPYYRGIKFDSVSDETVSFTITVQWKEGAKVSSIKRNVTLYNY